jgi:hypothetical protein
VGIEGLVRRGVFSKDRGVSTVRIEVVYGIDRLYSED